MTLAFSLVGVRCSGGGEHRPITNDGDTSTVPDTGVSIGDDASVARDAADVKETSDTDTHDARAADIATHDVESLDGDGSDCACLDPSQARTGVTFRTSLACFKTSETSYEPFERDPCSGLGIFGQNYIGNRFDARYETENLIEVRTVANEDTSTYVFDATTKRLVGAMRLGISRDPIYCSPVPGQQPTTIVEAGILPTGVATSSFQTCPRDSGADAAARHDVADGDAGVHVGDAADTSS